MIQPIRLATVHPALVHFTLGVVPVLVLGYLVAAWRRAEPFAFAADLALWVGAGITLLTFAFGLVSNATVSWPGGLSTWRWAHLALGTATLALFLVLALARAVARRRGARAGYGTLAAASALAVVALATGWVGGDVLVFHAGLAVEAAGRGALSPPVGAVAREPRDLAAAMGDVRARWAAATTALARMIVAAPSDDGFSIVEGSAEDLQALARWIQGPGAAQLDARGGEARARSQELSALGQTLETRSKDLARAAGQKNVIQVAQAMGQLTSVCAGCHTSLRWTD